MSPEWFSPDNEPKQQKQRRHPRYADIDRFLEEVRFTRQAYLGITEKMRETKQDADYDLTITESGS